MLFLQIYHSEDEEADNDDVHLYLFVGEEPDGDGQIVFNTTELCDGSTFCQLDFYSVIRHFKLDWDTPIWIVDKDEVRQGTRKD